MHHHGGGMHHHIGGMHHHIGGMHHHFGFGGWNRGHGGTAIRCNPFCCGGQPPAEPVVLPGPEYTAEQQNGLPPMTAAVITSVPAPGYTSNASPVMLN